MSEDLLAEVRNGEWLDAQHFCYHDALADLVDLVDSGACTPACLFGAEDVCTCRCGSVFHGRARSDWKPPSEDAEVPEWVVVQLMPDTCERCAMVGHDHPVSYPWDKRAQGRGWVKAMYRCGCCDHRWSCNWNVGLIPLLR